MTDDRTIQKERWRPIPSFPRHEVSDLGHVRHVKSGRTLNPYLDTKQKYRYISLYQDCVQYRRSIHSLVLEAFVGPRPDGMDVRHIDGDSSNNALPNLAYGTRSENIRDQVIHGRHARAAQTECIRGHPLARRKSGRRFCRDCARAAKQRWKARQKSAA